MPNRQPHSKAKSIEKITPEVKRNKSSLFATWLGVFVALAALTFTGYQVYIGLHPKPIVDNFTVSKVEALPNSPTNIIGIGTTGIISTFWKIVLSNIGERDLSIFKYEVFDKSDNLRLSEYYTNIEQGLYSCDGSYSPISLPISIPNGSSVPVCIKIGFVMDEASFNLVRGNFNGSPALFSEIESFLWANGTDVYGNEITAMEHSIKYPALENIEEQLFLINFYTARGEIVHRLLGYQICNGRVETQIPISCMLDDNLTSFTTPQP